MSPDTTWRTAVTARFGAAPDRVENALRALPDPLSGDRSRRPEFGCLVFHTSFCTDDDLSDPVCGYTPPAPYLRHVQHHAAQLHLILREVTDSTPGWVSRQTRP